MKSTGVLPTFTVSDEDIISFQVGKTHKGDSSLR